MLKLLLQIILCSVLSLWWVWSVFAIDYTLDDTTRVYDRADVISTEIEQKIDDLLFWLEQETNVQVVVITLQDLEWRVIEDVALQFGRENGVWDWGKNTWLVVLVAIDERQWRLEVWYGLEGFITDQQAYRLWTTILVPAFRQWEYGKWLFSLVEEIVPVLKWEMELQTIVDTSIWQEYSAFDILFFGGIIAFFFGAILSESAKTKKTKQWVAWVWSGLTWLVGWIMVWWTSLRVVIPLFFLRWMFLSAKRENTWGFSGRGWGYRWGSFSWWGFSGFGWGSFGWWGSGGSR